MAQRRGTQFSIFLFLAGCAAAGLGAQEAPAFDLGPPPTRNMFSLLQSTLVYQPKSPFLTGVGQWQVQFDLTEANILEVADTYEGMVPYGLSNRRVMTEPFYAAMADGPAPWYRNYPCLYWFDEEITRGTLQVRTGLGEDTDVWLRVTGAMHGGGILDTLAESFHSITGSHQWVRKEIAKDQCVVALSSYGQVTFYSQGAIPPKFQDPELGLVHQVAATASSGLSLTFEMKAPVSKSYGAFEGGWDTQGGLTGWWREGNSTFMYGCAYTHRGTGNAAYQGLRMSDDLGAHFGWQGRHARKVQPFLQLYWLSGFSKLPGEADFHKASLQHDLGVHWFVTPRTALSFRYVNNITNAGNTDDFQLAADLTARF